MKSFFLFALVVFLLILNVESKHDTLTFYTREIVGLTYPTTGANAYFSPDWSQTTSTPGATFVSQHDVYSNANLTGTPFGEISAACTQLLANDETLCTIDLSYSNELDKIMLMGVIPAYPNSLVFTNVVAITGGTGDFFGISGQASITFNISPTNPLETNYTVVIRATQNMF